MDELESELRSLDREIAQFVLEAFQREAPDALRTQLSAAIAEGLRPTQRALEAVTAAVGEARSDLARRVDEGSEATAGLKTDIAERARFAQEQAERRTFEVQQAVARVRTDLNTVRREILEGVGAAAAVSAQDLEADPYAADHAADPPGRRYRPSTRNEDWWRRSWPWMAAVAAVVILAAGATYVLTRPAATPTQLPPSEASGAPGGQSAVAGSGVAAAAADQDGFARVVAEAGTWTGERRKAALDTLCGGDKAACPDLHSRWLAGGRTRKETQAALAVTVAALAEADGCAAPAAPAGPKAPATEADPAQTLHCLLTEAGRAPHP